MIEPVFGDTKFNRGNNRFLRRGRAACRSEWRLINATGNRSSYIATRPPDPPRAQPTPPPASVAIQHLLGTSSVALCDSRVSRTPKEELCR